MEHTKTFVKARIFIEDRLHFDSDSGKDEARICLEVMKLFLPPTRLYILADSHRFAADFAQQMSRSYTHISEPEMCTGLENVHIIILNTGHRTERQQEIHNRIKTILKTRRGVTFWQIGKWR